MSKRSWGTVLAVVTVMVMAVAPDGASYFSYPGTSHWFFESDRPVAFHREAAASAWKRTLAFLNEESRQT
jgi:dienelactone hydrolase